MTLFLYSCFAVPLWAAMFALYFILRRRKLLHESLIAKCAGSFLSVASAMLALRLQGKSAFLPAAMFFVFCTVGDAVLELEFVPGMWIFGCGHILLICALTGRFSFGWWNAAVWAAAMGAAFWLFRREISRMGRAAVPACLYAAVLSGTLASALPVPFTEGNAAYWPLAVGSLCFFVSDLMVAKTEFSHLPEQWHKPIMLLYWIALYLISASLWTTAVWTL